MVERKGIISLLTRCNDVKQYDICAAMYLLCQSVIHPCPSGEGHKNNSRKILSGSRPPREGRAGVGFESAGTNHIFVQQLTFKLPEDK